MPISCGSRVWGLSVERIPTSVRCFELEVAWTGWRWYGHWAVTRKSCEAVSYEMSSEPASDRLSSLAEQDASVV